MSESHKTVIAVILDRSGSMQSIQTDMQGALNKFITDQQAIPGECLFTLAQFDDRYEVVYNMVPIADVKGASLVPRGSTALLDAMGKTITTLELDIAKMSEAPAHTIVCIITDGFENASREWNRDQVFALVTRLREKGWEFSFLGADQDAIQSGGGYGVGANSSLSFRSSGAGVASAVGSYASQVSNLRTGVSETIAYAAADRLAAMEEDNKDSTPSS